MMLVASGAPPNLPIRRNTIVLSATMAVNSAVLQLVAAVSSLTFVLVTGVRGLLGLGPAIFLIASGLTAVPAGRLMDRIGRTPVFTFGFALATLGCCVTALATHTESTPAVILGFTMIGAASGISLLIRTAAGDMYPPERRARGISYVLFGSVFGAILGPTVFSPLFAGKDVKADSLTVPWLVAGAIALVALVLVQFVRPDPKRIAELLGSHDDAISVPAAPLRELVRRPGVPPAMVAALASFGVMVSVMNLTGYVVVEHHHHSQDSVFPIIGAHVFGMYALVLVIGVVIDKVGRSAALEVGLIVMGALHDRAALGGERVRDRRPPARSRSRVEHLVRRRDRAARRPDEPGRARQAPRVQRPPRLAVRRVARAARRLRAGCDRRRGARARRDRDRHRARLPGHAPPGIAGSGGLVARCVRRSSPEGWP